MNNRDAQSITLRYKVKGTILGPFLAKTRIGTLSRITAYTHYRCPDFAMLSEILLALSPST